MEYVTIEYSEEIIKEYKKQNFTDILTDEDITNLFGESSVYPNIYMPSYDWNYYTPMILSDYEFYLLRLGFNFIEGTGDIEEWNMSYYGLDLGEYDQIHEDEQVQDKIDEYYDDLIDKYYGTSKRNENQYSSFDEPDNCGLNLSHPEVKKVDKNDALVPLDKELRESVKTVNMEEIIGQYKKQNKIDIITDDELFNIFEESIIIPDYYFPISQDVIWDFMFCNVYSFTTTETGTKIYELVEKDLIMQNEVCYDLGYAEQLSENDKYVDQLWDLDLPYWIYYDFPQISEGDFWNQCAKNNELEIMKGLIDLGDSDSIHPYDVCSDFWICPEGQSMEEMLQTSLQAEREILIIDDDDNVYGNMPWDEYIQEMNQYWFEQDMIFEEYLDNLNSITEEELMADDDDSLVADINFYPATLFEIYQKSDLGTDLLELENEPAKIILQGGEDVNEDYINLPF